MICFVAMAAVDQRFLPQDFNQVTRKMRLSYAEPDAGKKNVRDPCGPRTLLESSAITNSSDPRRSIELVGVGSVLGKVKSLSFVFS